VGSPIAEKPVARLVPVQRALPDRVPGGWKGKIWMAPDFDEPDEELINLMENGPIFPRESLTHRVTWSPSWHTMGSPRCR
jgi:hypothetical protein